MQIDYSDRYPKRLCRKCHAKLEDIHQFSCQAQKNQSVFARYGDSAKTNPMLNNNPVKMHKTTLLSNNDITIFAYDDLKLGQIIKDYGLLTLILKALKWDSSPQRLHEQLERLKNSNFQDVLCNPVLLQDEDMMQLLGPYTNREPSLSITRHMTNNNSNDGLRLNDNDDTNVTEMEVGVDPELFFPFEDDETRSAEEVITAAAVAAATASAREDIKPVLCMECPQAQIFNNEAELIEHNKIKHDTSVRLVEKKKPEIIQPVIVEKRARSSRRAEQLIKVVPTIKKVRLKSIRVPTRTIEPSVKSASPQLITAVVVATVPADTIIPAAVLPTVVAIPPSVSTDISVIPKSVPEPEPIITKTIGIRSTSAVTKKILPTATLRTETVPPDTIPLKTTPEVSGSRRKRKVIDKKVTRSRRQAEKLLLATTENKVQKRSTTSRFTCTQCGKKLSSKGNLKVHLDTHKPKGKFNCEKCGRV